MEGTLGTPMAPFRFHVWLLCIQLAAYLGLCTYDLHPSSSVLSMLRTHAATGVCGDTSHPEVGHMPLCLLRASGQHWILALPTALKPGLQELWV